MPDRKQLTAIKQLKPDTEMIVIYREDGQTMFLRELRFPKAGDKPAATRATRPRRSKMKPEGGDKAGADKDAKRRQVRRRRRRQEGRQEKLKTRPDAPADGTVRVG